MDFDPSGFVTRKLIDLLPDELKKKILQLQVLKAHAASIGHIPGELSAIQNIGNKYEGLGVQRPQNVPPLGSGFQF